MAKNKMRQEGFEEYQISGSTSYAPTDDPKILEAKARYKYLKKLVTLYGADEE